MNLILPDYLDIILWSNKKQYNQEHEMNTYLQERFYEEDSSTYEIYWFLAKIDLDFQLPLKESE